jgi:hypothetical protein
MYLGNRDDEQKVNGFLEDGWLVKDLQSVSTNDDAYAVVWIERKEGVE